MNRCGEQRDSFEVATAYWDYKGGHIEQPFDEWQQRKMVIEGQEFVAYVEKDEEMVELGRRLISADEALNGLFEIDIMTELQYDGYADYPDIESGQMKTIIQQVKTEEAGWISPEQALEWSGISEATNSTVSEHVEIYKSKDPSGRWWIDHQVHGATGSPWYLRFLDYFRR
jgi:hypothetical protein